jgi:taurine dioxygenase
VSCDEEPPFGGILHLHTIPETGGDTLFASMYAAYDALSPRLEAYLEGLTALHSWERTNRLLGIDDRGRDSPSSHFASPAPEPVSPRPFVNTAARM